MGIKSWKHLNTTVGTILVDLGKLSFGSLILGSILRGGFDPFQTFIVGTGVALSLFVVGVVLILRGKE
jgi:hypothetical protein